MAGIVIAIDGPSGSGKSSTAKAIAVRANWNYLDTGALYRAATWIALKENVSEGWEIIAAIKKHPIVFTPNPKDPKIFCGEVDVTTDIRGARVRIM
jgi:GTP-binding protein